MIMIIKLLRRFNVWMHKKWAYPKGDKTIADNMRSYWIQLADRAEK